MRNAQLASALFLFGAACSTELPHEAPFDDKAPFSKQAKGQIVGLITLENESDHSQVAVQLQNAARTYSVQTEADGAVALTGVVPGDYTLKVGTRYFEHVTETVTVKLGERLDLGARLLAARRTGVFGRALLEDKNGDRAGGVAVTLTRIASLRSAASAPVFLPAAAAVTATGITFSAQSDASGAYRLSGVPSGVYSLVASEPGAGLVSIPKVTVTGEDGDVEVKEAVIQPMFGFLEILGKVNGAVTTPTVTLKFTATGFPASIEVAFDPGFISALPVMSYTQTTTIDLPVGDGLKAVYVRYFDIDGNVSSTGGDTVILDTTPPQPVSFAIANTSPTLSPQLQLTYSALGATEMRVFEGQACAGAREPYVAGPRSYTVTGGEGWRHVAMQFFDAAGNATECLVHSIFVDEVAPVFGSALEIQYGASATSSNVVNVTFDVSGATRMKVGERADLSDAAWQSYLPSITFVLSPGDGAKTVYARYADDAGNVIPSVGGPADLDSIKLDTSVPTAPSIFAAYDVTTQTSVLLLLSAGVMQDMILSQDDPTFASSISEPYTGSKLFPLTGTDGTKTIYAKFRKSTGIETGVVSDTVILDRTAPILPSVRINGGAAVVTSNIVTLNLSAVDPASGLSTYMVSETNDFTALSPKPYQTSDVFGFSGGDGLKTVWVIFGDRAGLYSVPVSATVFLDQTPPSVGSTALQLADASTIGNGQTIRESRVYFASSVSDLTPLEMQVTTNGSFTGVAWEPYVVNKVVDLALPAGQTPELRNVQTRVRDGAGHIVSLLNLGFYLDTRAPSGTLTLTSPALTNDPVVSLSLSANEAPSDAQLSTDPAFTGASWFGTVNTTFTLPPGDGLRTVYARYRDGAGNLSSSVTVTLTLDQTVPALAQVMINGGAATSNDTSGAVNLQLSAVDAGSGVAKMKLANLAAGDCATALGLVGDENYAASRAWTLDDTGAGKEGMRWVCAALGDGAGNWSAPVSDAIAYDTAAPAVFAGGLLINGGAFYTTSTYAELALSATGATEMMAANGASFGNSIWEPYRSQIAWLLPASAVQFERTISVKFRDAAGNESSVYADTITLDTEVPASPGVSLNAGAPYATTGAVDLDLFAIGADRVRISNDPYFLVATEVPYSTSFAGWALLAGEGVRAVFAQFEDFAGNRSVVAQDSIVVDTQAPTGADFTITDGAYTPNLSIFLELGAAGATEMQIAEDACGGIWVPYSANASYTFASPVDGLKTIAVRFRDQAGNLTACILRTITLDSTYPRVTTITPRSGVDTSFFTIYGINFNGGGSSAGSVVFGGVVIPFDGGLGHTWSNSEVKSRVPLMSSPGPYDVFVRTANGKDSNATVFVAYPVLQSVSPTVSRVLENVVLSGKTLGYVPGTVTIGGVPAAVVGWSPSAVTVTVPGTLNAGLYEIVLTAGGLLGSGTTWVAVRPMLTSVTPGTGTQGTLLTLNGGQFGTDSGAGRVEVGGISATIVSWSPTQLEATVPAGVAAGQSTVQVFVAGIGTEQIRFDHPLPWIHASTPATGAVGAPLDVLGTGLGATTGLLRVAGVDAVVSGWAPTAISSQVPAGTPGTVDVTATTAAGIPTNTLRMFRRGADVWYRTPQQAYHTGAAMVWTGKEVVVWGGALESRPYRYNPATDTWLLGTDAGAPLVRSGPTAVWTGKEVIVYGGTTNGTGGRYNPATDSWANMAGSSIVTKHTAVWNGAEMLVISRFDQIAYSPATDTWRTLASVGSQDDARSAWTGSELLVWGGSQGTATGSLYDPNLNKWRSVNPAGAPTSRYAYGAVWTGTEFVAWGGRSGGTALTDGARYNPVTRVWTPMAAAPAGLEALEVNAVWLGNKMFVAGNGYATYDPVGDAWSSVNAAGAPTGFPVFIGDDVVVLNTGNFTGGRYHVSGDTWSGITWPYLENQVWSRSLHTAVWTGTQMIIWGGGSYSFGGGRYSPAMDQWTPTSVTNVPEARNGHGAVWTGTEMIIWGGDFYGVLGTGGRYNPATDSWTATSNTGAPSARTGHGQVWTGDRMLVWGGGLDTGGIYYPLSDTWSAITNTGAPAARSEHATIWAGDRMIIWGGAFFESSPGCDCFKYGASGAYFPATDSWAAVSNASAPLGRAEPLAIWTGTYMFIYGGKFKGMSPFFPPSSAPGGGRYDPATDTWLGVSATNAPISTVNSALAWTGTHVLLSGGRSYALSGTFPYYTETARDNAVMYDPATDVWTNMNAIGKPSARYGHSMIWTGFDAILFGGGSTDNVVWYQPYD